MHLLLVISAAAAISSNVRVEGLSKESIQGDIQFLKVLEKMGADITYEMIQSL